MKVGYFYFHALGDNVLAFDALYAIKTIYHCHLIVFGNAIFCNLLKHCDFIDEYQDIQNDISGHLELIDSYYLDYAILPKCKNSYLYPLLKTNVKTIIAPTKISSLFSLRCRTPSLFTFFKYRNMSMREKHLHIARELNRKLFDSRIKNLNFENAKIQTSPIYKNRITTFLNTIENRNEKFLVLINPFNITSAYSLSLFSYLKLTQFIAQIPLCIPIIATYPRIHQIFMETLKEFCNTQDLQKNLAKLLIFENDHDVLNLIELVSQMDCVISPSTGTIHCASNLLIPTIGLYPQSHLPQWETRDKRYVFINSPLNQITQDEEREIINQTLKTLKKISFQKREKTYP